MHTDRPSALERAGAFVRTLEHRVIDTLSATTPWLSPILPAYMVYQNVLTRLDLPEWVAVATGLAIESLGLITVHTTYQLWSWNQTAAEANRAPTWVAGAAGGFYLTTVLIVNVVLDWNRATWDVIVAKGLLSTITIVAAIVVAVRAQHSRRRAEMAVAAAERKAKRQAPEYRRGETPAEVSEPTEAWPGDWRKLSADQRDGLRGLTAVEIAEVAGVDDRTARNWAARLRPVVAVVEPISNGVAH